MKRVWAVLCVLCLLCGCNVGNNQKARSGGITVHDSKGGVIATLTTPRFSDAELADASYRSYVEFSINEAVTVLAATYACSTAAAVEKLFTQGYSLHTAADPSVHTAIHTMYAAYAQQGLAFGSAVTDHSGNLRAMYSGGGENYAMSKHPPFSTVKPLSIYAPAIENGLIDWSTKLSDTPYKQIPDEAGKMRDWPTNANGRYTYTNISLLESIKQSLNTTAVHCLASLGEKQTLTFLQESFGMDLTYEQNKLTQDGEEEIMGNLAMGYFYTGVTPVDLAGYYQIFGNGGQYTRPHAITKILDANGQPVYEHQREVKQIIGEDTAYIMNRLLNAVVMPGGTGAQAKVPNVELIGKTGTGDQDGGNWFVGVTPEYSCAVWHGYAEGKGNIAPSLFTGIMETMSPHTKTQFSSCATVHKGIYCSQSGKLFSSSCSQMQIGYYASDRKPAICDVH